MANGIYTVGGAVQAYSGLYIERAADRELLHLCRQGVFAYVLTARQMGKSSLMVSTAERLAHEDVRSVIVDLEKFGTHATAEAWYVDMLDEIAGQVSLQTDVIEWWRARDHFGMAHRLADFFREVLLAERGSCLSKLRCAWRDRSRSHKRCNYRTLVLYSPRGCVHRACGGRNTCNRRSRGEPSSGDAGDWAEGQAGGGGGNRLARS